MPSNLILFCDGGSRGNPGPSACGFVILETEQPIPRFNSRGQSEDFLGKLEAKVLLEKGVFLGETTNNVAEWNGLKLGLEEIKSVFGTGLSVNVFLDSELVCKQVTGIYKVKQDHLKPLHQAVLEISRQFQSFQITHIFREFNKQADALVNVELDSRK
jgi:ribonuclease HI